MTPGGACTLGGSQDSSRAGLSNSLFFFLFLFFFQPGAFSGFRGLAKCESRDTEGTDVIRRTRSTFSLQEVGSVNRRFFGRSVLKRSDEGGLMDAGSRPKSSLAGSRRHKVQILGSWSREVRISWHGRHRWDQEDEIYIFASRSMV